MTLNEKHKQVKDWLESIYIDEDVPPYEINTTTIECLYNLMSVNKSRDRGIQLSIEDMRQKADEYNAEAERIRGILKRLDLKTNDLSQPGITSLHTLTKIADILQLKHTSESCYLLALHRLDKNIATVEDHRRLVQNDTHKLFKKKSDFLLKAAKWKKALEDFEKQEKDQASDFKSYAVAASFHSKKAKEYRKQELKYFDRLRRLNLDPSQYHGALVKQAEALENMKEKLRPLKEKFNSYNNLPPDITMTKVKIEELKQNLEQMDRELNRRINVLHM